MKTFKDWLKINNLDLPEDSAFDRARYAAAQGLGPDIPDAEINSRSTAPPWQQDKFRAKHKHKGKKHKKHDD